ncbi:MAG: UPF0182 family protein [Candidatus Paceibacterota bacterium]|jgi:hypothetical protein
MKAKQVFTALTLLLVASILASNTIEAILEYWWYSTLSYSQVFTTNFVVKFVIFAILFTAMFTYLWRQSKILRARIAAKRKLLNEKLGRIRASQYRSNWESSDVISELRTMTILDSASIGIPVLLSYLYATIASDFMWFDILKYINQTPFGVFDPIFGNDIALYVFTIPVIESFLTAGLFFVLINCGIKIAIENVFDRNESEVRDSTDFTYEWRATWTILALVFAASAYFGRYSSMYNETDILYGANYMDVNFWIPFASVKAILFVLAAIACLIWKNQTGSLAKVRKYGLPILIAAVMILPSLIASVAAFAIYETQVGPNQLQKELPFIADHINSTRYGFDLDKITEKEYAGTAALTTDILNSPSVENIRIVDYRASWEAIGQKERSQKYYDFTDIDADRFDGKQVIITQRELFSDRLSDSAKNWVNQKLTYTHGYGKIVSLVNKVDSEGMPVLIAKGIPQVSSDIDIDISQPRIYYGESFREEDYAITNTRQPEFDYPSENTTVAVTYEGTGGIVIDSQLKRFVAAYNLGLMNIWFSEYLTTESRLHLHRNIKERVQRITPFVYLDDDPYQTTTGNDWILGGVVYTDKLPYSKPSYIGNTKMNYVRDSLKITVDNLNGTVTYYVIDWNPMIQTYAKIYPGLFKDISELPDKYRSHLKYPEDFFVTQIEKDNLYHMKDPEEFFKKSTQWVRAKEKYHEEEVPVEPYNIQLDMGNGMEFVLMEPVTPIGRENMIGWYAVRQDIGVYGKIILYKFPVGALPYGPMNIEAKIDQDEDMSALMTLWSQAGSKVIRGNLIVLPIEGSILYIKPIYISAATKPLPELKKIIVVYNDRLAIGDTLNEALYQAISGNRLPTAAKNQGISVIPSTGGTTQKVSNEKIATIVVRDENGNIMENITIYKGQSITIG